MATIEVTKDIQELLQALKKDHPELDEAEILRRALADYRKRELQKRRKEWEKSLPTLEISEEEKRSIAEARKGEFRELSVEELERYAEEVEEA
jgi:hypothetical protein